MNNIETALQKTVGFGFKEFAEKSIEGGAYLRVKWEQVQSNGIYSNTIKSLAVTKHEILMNPKAWEAVGKVEGWDNFEAFGCGCGDIKYNMKGQRRIYFGKMHSFIDNLF